MRMKNKRNYIATSTLTLTQSGLLAELFRYQRRKVIESAQRRTHHQQGPGFFGNNLTALLARAYNVTAGRRFRRGFEGETSARQT
jgi:MOSC domain-containing protein YiiM